MELDETALPRGRGHHDLVDTFNRAAALACRAMRADRVFVYLAERGEVVVRGVASASPAARTGDILGYRLPAGSADWPRVLQDRAHVFRILHEEHDHLHPARHPPGFEHADHAILVLPLYRDESVLGAIEFGWGEPKVLHGDEIALATVVAEQVALTIDANLNTARLEQSMLESAIGLNAILDSMTDAVIAFNQHQRVIFTNRRFFDLLGAPSQLLVIGKTVAEMAQELAPLVAELPLLEALRAVASQEQERLELQLEASARTVEVSSTPIVSPSGDRPGCLVLLRDITEVRQNERIKDELIAVIGHELRTPLTSILGYSKLLLDRPEAVLEKRSKWAQYIVQKSRVLNRLINDILDLSRLNMGRLELQLQSVELDDLVRRVADEFAEETGREITVTTEGEIIPILADENRLDQVITHLVSNAVKYSTSGIPISIVIENNRDGVLLSVTNRGPGITPEHLARIFEPFYRVDHSTTRSTYGTGLGLTISRQIIEAHGGTISAESVVGEKTVFTLFLPHRPPPG